MPEISAATPLVDQAGVDVATTADPLVQTAAAELTAYHHYTIMRLTRSTPASSRANNAAIGV